MCGCSGCSGCAGIRYTPFANNVIIPPLRRTDWSFVGVPGGIPNRTTICATMTPANTVADINNAIVSCSAGGGGVVLLSAGTYSIPGTSSTTSINIFSDNVTLRGAGADQTILQGLNIINLGVGNATNPSINIVGGGRKDSNTFTVNTTTGLSVNQQIEIDRDDDASIPVISTINGSRFMTQVNLITAINGNVITVKNPLLWDFSTGNPAIKFVYTGNRFSGIENLKLDYSAAASEFGHLQIQNCYGCWVKGVHSYLSAGVHLLMLGTLNGEFRDSFIDSAQTFGNNNGGIVVFGNPSFGGNSHWKIENNILNKLFPGIQVNSSSSGNMFSYNYGYATAAAPSAGPVTYMFDDNHGPFDIMNLWEGNMGEQLGSDGYYGGAAFGTLLRNYFTGYNPFFATTGDSIVLKRLSYNYNIVGNVLGSSLQTPLLYEENAVGCTGGPAIYAFGYPNIGNCDYIDNTGNNPVPGMTYPDVHVRDTLLRWGNYDYFNNATQFIKSEIPSSVVPPTTHTIPLSYYYSTVPTWWPVSIPWPPIGPDVNGGNGDTAGHANKLPAQVCFETHNLLTGGAFNASSCYP